MAEVATTTSLLASPSSSSSSSAFTDYPLVSELMAFTIAKFFYSFRLVIFWVRGKTLNLGKLAGSGGMPSSHSSTVMYDASGVRLHAGRQAEVLNQIVYELPAEHPLSESRPLQELLGHTPTRVVAGCFLGIVTAVAVHLVTLIFT